MVESNFEYDKVILGVKEIILNIVNEGQDTVINLADIQDEEEIATSTVLQMDSIKAIKIVVEIERKFGISVPDEDLDMDNFKHAAAMASYVISHKNVLGVNDGMDNK